MTAFAVSAAAAAEERKLVPCLRLAPATVVLMGQFETVAAVESRDAESGESQSALVLRLDRAVCVRPQHESQSQFLVDETNSRSLERIKRNLGKRVKVSGMLTVAPEEHTQSVILVSVDEFSFDEETRGN